MSEVASVSMVDARLCTSAQPSPEQLAGIGDTGVRHVINLAMADSDAAVADEGAVLAAQGINYLHLPVAWERPQAAQFLLFAQVLYAMREDTVLVHCACNLRASAFVFLYRVIYESVPLAEAAGVLHAVWRPEGVWRDFLLVQLAERGFDYEAVA